MFISNLNDYKIPLKILGILILLGIPLMILSEIILIKYRRIKHAKIIFGLISIIFGITVVIIGIWEDIGWDYYLKICNPCIMANYTPVFALSIVLCIVLGTHGIILIHKSRISE
ncbi:MAG: hypothetical protein ACW98D_04450 [Promethearchaeota archaeon]|jgi:hypothetical protein